MPYEIERKFLVIEWIWRDTPKPSGRRIRQAYLFESGNKSCRIRLSDDRALLNFKRMTDALHRAEFEYEIPLEEGLQLFELFGETRIEKTRYEIPAGGHLWEVDVFEGANEGLLVAEIELSDAGEIFERPDWLGEEVTHDLRYLNTSLARHPWCQWEDCRG